MNGLSPDLVDKLNTLAEYYAQRDAATLAKQNLIDQVYTSEIRQAVKDIEAEFVIKTAAVSENIAALESEIKSAVKNHGATVRGNFLMAVYNKGRVSWDTKALDGLAAAFPILNRYRSEGEPSVSIRVKA